MSETHAIDLQPPKLVTVRQICEAIPSLRPRTVRYWIQQARPREVSQNGRRSTLAGNGLGRAVIRRGGLTLVDWDLFLQWLYEGRVDA